MNYYDDERNIIQLFRDDKFKAVIISDNPVKMRKIINRIIRSFKWKHWTYNAKKSDPPPDFYSDKYGLAMEVMRVDDHAFLNDKGKISNPVNEREHQIQRNIRRQIMKAQPDIDISSVTIMVNAASGLPSVQDHNYIFYRENFKRTLDKHIKHISLYRKNQPNKKLIFFVFDESTGYLKVNDEELVKRGPLAKERFEGDVHYHFLDKAFVDVFKEADIDYLIWYTPYKQIITNEKIYYPKVCVVDVKDYDYRYVLDYDERLMISSEQ